MNLKLTLNAVLFTVLSIMSIDSDGANVMVTNINDSGEGSFRAAVASAAMGDTVSFNPSTNNMQIVLTTGEILIEKAITIIGNGGNVSVISGNNASRIFNVANAGVVTLSEIGLVAGFSDDRGGAILTSTSDLNLNNVAIQNSEASGAAATQGGGGIANVGGSVTITSNSQIVANVASGASGSGGGILNIEGGVLTVMNSIISRNQSNRAGGGIEDNNGGTISLVNVQLDSNSTASAPGNGGGLHITGPGNATIIGGTVMQNSAAAEGGGLWNGAGTMSIDSTMISGNIASGADADQGGGGIYNLSGILVIINAVISNNIADGASGSGGGILNDAGATLMVTNTVISGNQSNRAGGGIEDNSGAASDVSLIEVSLVGNTTGSAPGNGGGLHITGAGNVIIEGGIVTQNIATAEGGGLWNGAGTMTINGTSISGNTASGEGADQGGGGIYNLSGILVVNNAVISDNITDGASGSGGGILNDVGATLMVTSTVISGNQSNRAGGGIEDNSGAESEVSLIDVSLDGNATGSAPGNGGGLHITGAGNVIIEGGKVTQNIATAEGGGLWNGAGTMTINGTSISGNTASGALADQGGGGIYNLSGILVVNNAVISDNIADGASGSGGGILNDIGATLMVTSSVISGNQSNRGGGGIEDNSGAESQVSLRNVSLEGNATGSAPGNGGGLHITGAGNVIIEGGIVTQNIATAEGGGLWNGSGTMSIDSTVISGNTASGEGADQGGGGIYNLSGILILNDAVISGNIADGASGSGGGILNDAGATLMVSNTVISGNQSNRAGGGIEDNSGAGSEISLINVVLDSNSTGSAPGNGGGLHITGPGNSTIQGGSVTNNTAMREGGGLWNGSGLMVIKKTDISANESFGSAIDDGGAGVFNNGGTLQIESTTISGNVANGDGNGGGLHNNNGFVWLERSTVSGNSAGASGGAIHNLGILNIYATTIVQNTSNISGAGLSQFTLTDTTSMGSSILAGNLTSGTGMDITNDSGVIISQGYNLIGATDFVSIIDDTTNITGTLEAPVDPLVAELADNGGSTKTHALLCPSPAINTGDTSSSLDQRDSMIFESRRDIGSFELQIDCETTPVLEEDSELFGTLIYPNPTNGNQVNIKLPSVVTGKFQVRVFELTSGKTVLHSTSVETEMAIQLSTISSGAYVIQILTDKSIFQRKLLINK